jgi:leucyl/phenylalanyl-tRNA--protein transferase
MTQLSWLDENTLSFPPPNTALTDPNGLLAAGGDLSVERLLLAYRQGIFPWYEEDQPILWWSPSPRAVLFPEDFKLSKSLKKTLRRGTFTVSCDTAFDQVIQHCADTPRHDQNGTWINDDMIDAYDQLHKLGHAHSIETWQDNQLVGGLYGIAIGRVFFGESMFSLKTDASKVAFVHLTAQLKEWQFPMIDCQVSNPHLISLGAKEISRNDFEKHLKENVDQQTAIDWRKDWNPQLAL